MKSKFKIRVELKRLEEKSDTLEKEYSKLHQIDLQSSTGNHIYRKLQKIYGKINALNWVLDD